MGILPIGSGTRTGGPVITSALLALVCWGTGPGCARGIEAPDPTPLKTIIIKDDLYQLGSSELACKGSGELDSCDVTGPAEGLTWAPRPWARLPEFQIEEREVSNLQYRYCVDAEACTPPGHPREWSRYDDPAFDHYPVVYVTQSQASDYCRFIKRRLPTEAHWEAAARGEADASGSSRTFPWGSAKPGCSSKSEHYLAFVSKGCVKNDGPLPPRYSSADTLNGVLNMASNVAEWVVDQWRPFRWCENGDKGYQGDGYCFFAGHPDLAKQKGCAASCDPKKRVICRPETYSKPPPDTNTTEGVVRGGSFEDPGPCNLRLFVRRKVGSSEATRWLGFRCALWQDAPALEAGPDWSADHGR